MAIRVLLADDNALFRLGLTGLLQQCRDVDVVGQARNTDEALHQTAVLRLDVVLLDHAMPFTSGVDVTKQLLTHRFQVRICLLAVSEQAPDVFEAVAAGARGYLPKTASLAEFDTALHAIARGGVVIRPPLAAHILQRLDTATRTGAAPSVGLTERERAILHRLIAGDATAAIATRLALRENDLQRDLQRILTKLQHQGGSGGDGPAVLGAGVPRRPSPGGLTASAEARPDPGRDP